VGGVLFMAMPITIVGSSFAEVWEIVGDSGRSWEIVGDSGR